MASSVQAHISPDSTEFRLIAAFVDIDARRLALAFNSPETFERLITTDEVRQFTDAMTRLAALEKRMSAILDSVLARVQAWHPAYEKPQES